MLDAGLDRSRAGALALAVEKGQLAARQDYWASNDGAIGPAFDGFLEYRAFLLASSDAALPDRGAGARRAFRPELRRAALALDPGLYPVRRGRAAGRVARRPLERRR